MKLISFGTLLMATTILLRAEPTQTIGFDGLPILPSGFQIGIDQYCESGFAFTPLGEPAMGNVFLRTRSGDPRDPDNSTHFLASTGPDTLQFSFTPGALFGLVSLELSEYSTVVPNAVTVEFVGYRYDGGIVRRVFTTDGIIDGTGPLPDFETFTFGPEFTDLIRVEVPPSWGWSLDNVTVVIPEPTVCALVALGMAVIWLRSSRRCATAIPWRVNRDSIGEQP